MDYGEANVSRVQKSNVGTHLTIGGINDDMVPNKEL
jgi:hypothetical protein